MPEGRTFHDAFGHTVELTAERWLHVLAVHRELQTCEQMIPQTLQQPDTVIQSIYDPHVRLYYKKLLATLWHGKYLVVVVKYNQRHFILTAYLTDRIKGGVRLWPSG